jgi:predicted HicB family RNase H-like nuclease
MRAKPPTIHKTEVLQIRISEEEKQGFEIAAMMSGISLSSWVRERLRLNAIRELEGAGKRVPFVPEIPLGGTR